MAIQEKLLGPDHMYVGLALENLGALLLDREPRCSSDWAQQAASRAQFERVASMIEAARFARELADADAWLTAHPL